MKAETSRWHYDLNLLFPALLLVGIGIVMVYSASSAIALKRYGTDIYFVKKQALYAIIGLVALITMRQIPYKLFKIMAYPLLFGTIGLLLVLKFSGLGITAGGAQRWIRVAGFSFQPAEFAKFALIVYLSDSMSRKGEKLKDFYIGFVPHLMVLGVLCFLVMLQPDFGSAVILFAIAWIMMFIGGVRIKHLAVALLPVLPAIYFVGITAEYRLKRIISFLDPWKYHTNEGYQIVHSLMAFGTGGIWGTGIGRGYQKLFYLPEPHTDFIISVIGEELGLVGVIIILALFSVVIWRGIIIAKKVKDPFGAYLATGITVMIALGVCVNIMVATGMLPTKGLTLPLLSYGGTSLLINMAAIGILLNIEAGAGFESKG